MTTATSNAHRLALGRAGLQQLHRSLAEHAGDQAVTVLQEAGFAAGEGLFQTYRDWLRAEYGVDHPEELDSALFTEALSAFFLAQGWGAVTISPLAGALAVDSADWAEAEPGTAEAPMCFFSTGMLADFLGRLSGEPVAVMEVECRSRNDARCRFLSATTETLQRVYEEMTQGKTYEEALG
jgi:predicted hydrocarbon binding protein